MKVKIDRTKVYKTKEEIPRATTEEGLREYVMDSFVQMAKARADIVEVRVKDEEDMEDKRDTVLYLNSKEHLIYHYKVVLRKQGFDYLYISLKTFLCLELDEMGLESVSHLYDENMEVVGYTRDVDMPMEKRFKNNDGEEIDVMERFVKGVIQYIRDNSEKIGNNRKIVKRTYEFGKRECEGVTTNIDENGLESYRLKINVKINELGLVEFDLYFIGKEEGEIKRNYLGIIKNGIVKKTVHFPDATASDGGRAFEDFLKDQMNSEDDKEGNLDFLFDTVEETTELQLNQRERDYGEGTIPDRVDEWTMYNSTLIMQGIFDAGNIRFFNDNKEAAWEVLLNLDTRNVEQYIEGKLVKEVPIKKIYHGKYYHF